MSLQTPFPRAVVLPGQTSVPGVTSSRPAVDCSAANVSPN